MTNGFSTWLSARLGKFTASEIHKLLKGGTRPMTEAELAAEKASGGKRKTVDTFFGDGALTYIHSRVAEFFTQMAVSDFNSEAMAHGNLFEKAAAVEYEKRTGFTVEYLGGENPIFLEYGDFAGGSPDALVNDDGMAEFKCPFVSTHHIEYLLLNSPEELKKEKPDYYAQIQMNLLVSQRNWCDFVSYDSRMLDEDLQMKILRIPRDEAMIEDIKARIEAASQIMYDKIKLLTAKLPTPNLIEAQ
jgi:hypothetical protein